MRHPRSAEPTHLVKAANKDLQAGWGVGLRSSVPVVPEKEGEETGKGAGNC